MKKTNINFRDIYIDIPPIKAEKYQKEKELVKKIASALLPDNSFKIRFITNRDYKGLTLSVDLRNVNKGQKVYSVCFTIEYLLELEKEDPGIFMDVVAHELAHAEAFKNLQYNFKNTYYCSCKTQKVGMGRYHEGEGHDKIWHDKYDEFREKIKNKKLVESSGFQALGKDFVRSEYKNDNGSDKPKENPTSFPTKSSNKEIWWTVGVGSFIIVGLFFVCLFRKRKKTKK